MQELPACSKCSLKSHFWVDGGLDWLKPRSESSDHQKPPITSKRANVWNLCHFAHSVNETPHAHCTTFTRLYVVVTQRPHICEMNRLKWLKVIMGIRRFWRHPNKHPYNDVRRDGARDTQTVGPCCSCILQCAQFHHSVCKIAYSATTAAAVPITNFTTTNRHTWESVHFNTLPCCAICIL